MNQQFEFVISLFQSQRCVGVIRRSSAREAREIGQDWACGGEHNSFRIEKRELITAERVGAESCEQYLTQ